MSDIFNSIGAFLGQLIRLIVDGLGGVFANLDNAAGSFLEGLSESLGIPPTLISLVVLVIGLWLLWKGLAALVRRAIIATLLWWLLGVTVLSWLIQ